MKGKKRTEGKAWIADTKIYGRVKIVKKINLTKTFGPNLTMEEAEKCLGRAVDGNIKDMFSMLMQNQMVLQHRLRRILREVKQLKTDLSVSSKGKSAK